MPHDIPPHILKKRLARDFTPEEAVAYPANVRYMHPIRLQDGRFFPNQVELGKGTGQHAALISQRRREKWTYDQIAKLDDPPEDLVKLAFPMTFDGVEYPDIEALGERFDVHASTLAHRLRCHWTIRQAVGLDGPPGSVTYQGVTYDTVSAFVRAFRDKGGVKSETRVGHRLKKRGWTPGQAIGFEPPPVEPKPKAKPKPAPKTGRGPYCLVDGTPYTTHTDVANAFDAYAYKLREGGRTPRAIARVLGIDKNRVETPLRAVTKRQYDRRRALGFSHDDALRIPPEIQCSKPVPLAGVVYGSLVHIQQAFGVRNDTVHTRNHQDRLLRLIANFPSVPVFDWNETDAIAHAVSANCDRDDVIRKLHGGLTYDQATGRVPTPDVLLRYDERDFYTLEAFSQHVGYSVDAVRNVLHDAPGTTLQPAWFKQPSLPVRPGRTVRKHNYKVNDAWYKSFEDAVRAHRLDKTTVLSHLYGGATIEQAFGHDPLPEPLTHIDNVPFYTLQALYAHTGVTPQAYSARRRNGLSLEQAFNIVPPWE